MPKTDENQTTEALPENEQTQSTFLPTERRAHTFLKIFCMGIAGATFGMGLLFLFILLGKYCDPLFLDMIKRQPPWYLVAGAAAAFPLMLLWSWRDEYRRQDIRLKEVEIELKEQKLRRAQSEAKAAEYEVEEAQYRAETAKSQADIARSEAEGKLNAIFDQLQQARDRAQDD